MCAYVHVIQVTKLNNKTEVLILHLTFLQPLDTKLYKIHTRLYLLLLPLTLRPPIPSSTHGIREAEKEGRRGDHPKYCHCANFNLGIYMRKGIQFSIPQNIPTSLRNYMLPMYVTINKLL